MARPIPGTKRQTSRHNRTGVGRNQETAEELKLILECGPLIMREVHQEKLEGGSPQKVPNTFPVKP